MSKDKKLVEGGWWAGFLTAVIMLSVGLFMAPEPLTKVDVAGITITSAILLAGFAWLEARYDI